MVGRPVALVHEPIEPGRVAGLVADPEHGGTALFVGTTRAEAEVDEVVALEYEAFEVLALAEMRRIVATLARAHGARVAMVHRLGLVRVGEPAVVVATSARHRASAFAACIDAMDLLKADVPIWKCTHHTGGRRVWDPGAGAGAADATA